MANKYWTLLILLFLSGMTFGQKMYDELSLLEAYALLEERYPALNDAAINEEILQKELYAIDRSRLPEIAFKIDGRVQSESPSLDLPDNVMLPFEIDLPLYSAKAYVEAKYLILDGGIHRAKKKTKQAALKAEQQGIEVTRFKLRSMVNQIFVNLHILRQQAALFDISIKSIEDRRTTIEAGVSEGVLLESELSKLEVKWLELKNQQSNVASKISGLKATLADLLDIQFNKDVELGFPELSDPISIPEINRPEQLYFQEKQSAVLANAELLDAKRKPKLAAFAQGGVGYPNPLNFLDNETSGYGLLGLNFNWLITDWNQTKTHKEILQLQSLKLQNAKESFDFNLENQKAKYLAEVDRIKLQSKNDQKIADLQKELLDQMSIQLEEGVISASEYVNQVNNELAARQKIIVHQTELLKLQLDFWNERGAF